MSRRYLLGTLAVLIAVALAITAGVYAGKASEMSVQPQRIQHSGYALLTWMSKSGDICYAIVPQYNKKKFANNWFSKWNGVCGISQLKENLSALPKGETVEWNNFPPRFTYPQRKVAEDLEEFAKSKGVQLILNPALDVQMFPDGPP